MMRKPVESGAWEEHVSKFLHKKGELKTRYHMTKAAFDHLVALLHIQVDHKAEPMFIRWHRTHQRQHYCCVWASMAWR